MILGVNIDHIATLRQARRGKEPDPLMAVPLAILGGADGITVHLREDRRHIMDRDLRLLREVVPIELNLEMAATDEMISIAIEVRPDMVTIVPEKREELTTEGGLDIRASESQLATAIARLHEHDIPVSLFIDPQVEVVDLARQVGADMVELHTGLYANAPRRRCGEELLRVVRAAEHSLDVGLLLNAGHGLNYQNVGPIASIEGMRGLYIGHSIISRAVLVGIERAVAEMKALILDSVV